MFICFNGYISIAVSANRIPHMKIFQMETFRRGSSYTISKITGRLPKDYHLAMLGLERGNEWLDGNGCMRKRYGECAFLIQCACGGDVTAMGLDDSLRPAQAETGTLL